MGTEFFIQVYSKLYDIIVSYVYIAGLFSLWREGYKQ